MGTEPLIEVSSPLARRRGAGSTASRPCVYGWRGFLKSSSTSATSTMFPAYITATLSHISATTARSWVIRRIDASICVLELPEQLQDLGLDGHVERGRYLVRDEERRPPDQRHRYHRPLAHPPGELEGIRLEHPLGLGEPDPSEDLDGVGLRQPLELPPSQDLPARGAPRAWPSLASPPPSATRRCAAFSSSSSLAATTTGVKTRLSVSSISSDLRPDREDRVQVGQWVLEDHGHLPEARRS